MSARAPLEIARAFHQLPATDAAGLALHVRHVSPQAPARGSVVLVHGATLASGLWDIAVPGYSLLEALARAGFSAWAPDMRGYARSARPHQPVGAYAGLRDALADVGAVVAHVQRHDRVGQVLLVGGSWGSITAAAYAAEHGDALAGLALVAPLYGCVNPHWLADLADPKQPQRIRPSLGATRTVTRGELLRRRDPEIPHADKSLRRDPAVLDALLHDAIGAEPQPRGDGFVVPNGTLHDLFEVFSGRPLYDPECLAMPVLPVRGEHDDTATHDDSRLLFERLATSDKQWLTIGDAGHFVCAERRAPLFQQALIHFAARLQNDGPMSGLVPNSKNRMGS